MVHNKVHFLITLLTVVGCGSDGSDINLRPGSSGAGGPGSGSGGNRTGGDTALGGVEAARGGSGGVNPGAGGTPAGGSASTGGTPWLASGGFTQPGTGGAGASLGGGSSSGGWVSGGMSGGGLSGGRGGAMATGGLASGGRLMGGGGNASGGRVTGGAGGAVSTGGLASGGRDGSGGGSSGGSGGGSSGGSGGGSSGGSGGGPARCTQHSDCRVFTDCCTCVALGPGEPNPESTCGAISCAVSACTSHGADSAECRDGQCVLVGSNCNASNVECNTPPPSCPAGWVRSVIAGCWGACIPEAKCGTRFAISCAACSPDWPCIATEYPDSPRGFSCPQQPASCTTQDCACLGATLCPSGYTCIDHPSDADVECRCPGC